MAKTTTIEVTIFNVKRAASSRNGNPRFEFNTSHGKFKTAPDTSAAYEVENYFIVGTVLDTESTLIIDGRRNIIDWTVLDGKGNPVGPTTN